MKNLILKSSFHEKLKVLIIPMMLLTLGAGQMWAMDVKKPKVYFNNQTPNWNTSNFYFAVGHGSYTRLYYTTTISNTKLQYVNLGTYDCSYCSCDCQQWGDATYVAFCRTTSAWDQAGSYGYDNIKNAQKYSGQKNSYNMNSGNTYYCYMANANNGANLSVDYKSSGYSDIPKFNATQSAKKRDTGTNYSTVSGSWPATLKLQGTYLSGDGASTQSTITSTASTDGDAKKVYGAVVTGKITHSYESLNSSYYFEGWGTGSTPSSTDDTYSYNISAATTVYAFFSKKYTLTYDRKGTYGTSTLSVAVDNFSGTKTSGSSIPTGHQITFTATPASGYVIEGWYSDAECTVSLDNGQNTTYTISSLNANKSVYVKFEKLKTITIKFAHEATAGWVIQGVTKYPTSGGESISADGTWVTMTFTNVYAVSNIDLAYAGGGEWDFLNTSTKITDDCCYNKDGSLNASCCVPRANPTWGTAPASGAVGGSMTASVSGAPTGATITWSSTNTSAATISSSGVISYRAVGNTTIKANVSWGASGDYCAGSYELSQAISVTSGATVSAVRACPEYVSSNSGQVKLDISSTGASTGWYYRVCNSTKTAYYAPDEQSAASNTLSWTMNGSLPTGSNTLVVELYNSARQLVCTSSSVTVNVEIAESVTISAGANGSVSPSGIVYANNNHVHPSITATANTNYHFVNWTSNNAAASVADANSATTTVTATASGYTITANFAGDQYSITYKDKGNVAYTGNNEGSLPATHTYGTATTLVNGSKTGFTFDGWYTDAACTVSAGSSIGATAKTSNFTLYAKWTENMSTLSTSNHYDAGDPGYAAPTVSGSATNVGYATTRTITATAAGTGYTFDGWTLTNCTRTDGGAAKATSITIRSNGDGAAATVVANYTEVLTSRWHLVGNSSDFPDGWNVNNTTMMQKKTGHSTESAVYFTVNVTSTDTKEFKVVDDNGASSDIWYGYSTGSTYLTWTGTSTKNVYTGDGNANNLKYTPTVVGSYEFKVDYSGTYPAVTITYPTKYTVTYSVSPTGAADAITTSPTIASGGEIAAGTSVTFTRAEANDGYTWYRWEDGSGSSLGTGSTYTTTIDANTEVIAKYTANQYAVTLQNSGETGYGSGTASRNVTATYNDNMPSVASYLPTAANGYAFVGYYDDHNGEGTQYYNASGTSTHKWDKASTATLYAYFKKAEITTLTFVKGTVAPGETVQVTPTIDPTPVGTTHIDWRVLYNNDNPLSPQPSISTYNTNGIQFDASSTSGTYRVEAILRTGNVANAGTELSKRVENFIVAGSHTVTIQYQDGDGLPLASSVELTARPLDWSDEISPAAITGYTFARWDAGEGVSITDDNGTTTKTTTTTANIKVKANYDGTLTAVYTKKRMIYFYNTLNWGSVYVYFYKNDSYWQNDSPYNGSGANTTYTWTNTPYSEGKHGQMQPVSEGSKIYYFDAEAAGVNASYDDVVFTEHLQHGYNYFYQTNAVRRGDYKSTTMPMFVPLADQTADVHNQTNYYNNGYWMNYPDNTGYTLKIYNWYENTEPVREYKIPYSADLTMPLKLEVEFNDAGTHEYWFMVYRNDGTYFGNTYTFNQSHNAEQVITGGNNRSKLVTSAPGIYTFTLTYHGDNANPKNYNYYIDIDFPIAVGDYRIVYTDNTSWSKGTHGTKWYHPSDVINKATDATKTDIVSFYIAKGEGITTSMKFQYASAITDAGVVTWSDVSGGGITIPSSITKSGVYNFFVSQPAGGASISLDKVEPYSGDYYIRTDCAGNTKWDSYKAIDHEMTYSDYAAAGTDGFTHYFAHWVTTGTNVKFVIANDYSPCVSDTLSEDYGTAIANITAEGSDGEGTLNSGNANIRFMYDERTNKIKRAYISGSSVISDRFLVLEGDAKMYDENGNALNITGLNANEINLVDDENFVYERTIKVNATARAKLTADYNSNVQYFKGSATGTWDASTVQLLGGTYKADEKYPMRIVYDFKTNRLVAGYLPEGEIDQSIAINADLMLIREHQGEGQQIIFGEDGALSEVKTVYGVMRLNRWTLNNRQHPEDTNKDHSVNEAAITTYHPLLPVGSQKSVAERGLYWISFPFDVNLSDVFGFGTYGTHWILMDYNGAQRAIDGYWKDSEGFWEYIWDRRGVTLKAGKGYVLALELDLMKYNNGNFWNNNIQQIELFFPSASNVNNISKTDVEITVPEHECTIDRRTDKTKPDWNKDRRVADSHWNIIGVPSYANYAGTLKDVNGNTVEWHENPKQQGLPFLYEWNANDNSYTVQSGTNYPFKTMHAYYVQYAGKLKWSLASATPSNIIARRTYAAEPTNIEMRLELQQNEKMIDQTFVKLSDDEEVSAGFAFGEDLNKEKNVDKANIYTFIENYMPSAGNTLPLDFEKTTIVPVGVDIATDGEYIFSIPNGTEGVGVTLVDNETGTRTNLALSDYAATLPAGTYDERFVLEISPIEQIVTNVELINGENGDAALNGVCKKLIDGVLYIVKDGKVFDARGARIQ